MISLIAALAKAITIIGSQDKIILKSIIFTFKSSFNAIRCLLQFNKIFTNGKKTINNPAC